MAGSIKGITIEIGVSTTEAFVTEQNKPLSVFDGDLFRRIVDKMVIRSHEYIVFTFKCGMDLKEYL